MACPNVATGNEAASFKQQMGHLVRWFVDWSEMQKSDFLPILVQKLAADNVNGIVDRVEMVGLKDRPPTLFKCQLKLFDEWFDNWESEERNDFVKKLQEVDNAFYEKYEKKLSGEEDRIAAEREREFEAIIASAYVKPEESSMVPSAPPIVVQQEVEVAKELEADVQEIEEEEPPVVDGQGVATLVMVNDDDKEIDEDQVDEGKLVELVQVEENEVEEDPAIHDPKHAPVDARVEIIAE